MLRRASYASDDGDEVDIGAGDGEATAHRASGGMEAELPLHPH